MIEQTLLQTVTLLGVTIAILVVFRRLGVPSSLGFLLVGILLGSQTAGPVIQSDYITTVAQFGIVFLLFSIGLSFSVAQIYALRHTIMGLGTAQVALTTLIVALLAWLLGVPAIAAFVIGAVFAQSSTTIISKQLDDQGEHLTRHGRLGVTLSVFQDITAVPFVVIIPILGVAAGTEIAGELGLALVKAAVAFAGVLFIGRILMRPLFQLVAQRNSLELFTLTVLFVSLLAALVTNSLGLSMAFGAFLAGMVLGETEFRHQVESSIRPFKDVLLGLFFISIGMLFDPGLLPDIWLQALSAALMLLLVKLIVVTAIIKVTGVDFQSALRTGLLIAVGGEFGFALLAIGLEGQVIASQTAQVILNAVLFSMVLGTFLIRFNLQISRLICRVLTAAKNPAKVAADYQTSEISSPQEGGHVVLCGYGRIGQAIGHFLEKENIVFVALDLDTRIVREANLAGEPVFFGDSSEASVLESAGLGNARLMIIAHDDLSATLSGLRQARTLNPEIPILVRTRDELHLDELRDAGATEVIPETLETTMMMASQALLAMGVAQQNVIQLLQQQRADRYSLVREMFRGQMSTSRALDIAGMGQLHSIVLDSGSPAVGQTISDLALADQNVSITTLVRDGQRENGPDPGTQLEAGDVMVLLGNREDLERAESRLTGAPPDS